MAIDRDQRDRMELELAGYRSARILGERASWLFHGGNLERGLAQKLLQQVDNGSEKASYYYKIKPRGIREMKAAGPGFTYGTLRACAKRRLRLTTNCSAVSSRWVLNSGGLVLTSC